MTRVLGVAGLAAAFFLGAGALTADDKEEKKGPAPEKKAGVDFEALFKKLDKDGDGKLSLEEFKRLEEFYRPPQGKGRFGKGGLGGRLDADMIKKLVEQFGGQGGLDPERLKKMAERFGKGKGGFDPEMIRKLIEQFGGLPGAEKKAPAKKEEKP